MNRQKSDNENGHRIDAALARAAQTGDNSAFDKLVRRHKDRIFNLCYRFLNDYQEAEDASQDVFVKVFVALKRFRFESTFSTWIYRITVNTCTNRLKSGSYRRRKRSTQLPDTEEKAHLAESDELGEKSVTPADQVEKKQRMIIIKDAIESLPVKQKTLVVLRDIEGLSYEEITSITGVKSGTLKSRLARARLNLREKLRDVI